MSLLQRFNIGFKDDFSEFCGAVLERIFLECLAWLGAEGWKREWICGDGASGG